jgi:Fe2+ transport system protein FeoA
MPCATELVHGEGTIGGAIKVGTTGTIGSLMTRELDAIKVEPQATATPRLRRQGCPVSVSCGATPRKVVLRKSSSDITSSSNGNRTDRVSAEEACKSRRVSRRNTFNSPMLRSDCALVDRSPNTDKTKKKGSGYGVEVVDVKCGNPMSSRLRKLGFSKLSETFA